MAERAKKPRKKQTDSNAPSDEAVNEYLTDALDLHADMEEAMASFRSRIGKSYETATAKLGVTKTSWKHLVSRKLYEARLAKRVAKMGVDDKDALKKLSQSLGDTPFGKWINDQANGIPESSE